MIDIEQLRDYCLAKRGATEGFPFDEHTLVLKVCNKMFAVFPLNRPDCVVLKCDPDYSQHLRDHYSGVDEAYHFEKRHWNAVYMRCDVPDDLIYRLVDLSYELVLHQLPKKTQIEFFAQGLPADVWYEHLNVIDSTMVYLRKPEVRERLQKFVLIDADFQKSGHGQRGTHWESDNGKNLTFGLLAHPHFLKADEQFRLSEIAALAVVDALAPYFEAKVKWPNDVYYGNKKICGMLLEHDLHGSTIAHTIVGPGINVNQPFFFSDAPNPISVAQILGFEVNRFLVLERWLTSFMNYYKRLERGERESIDFEYKNCLYRQDGIFRYKDAAGEFHASFVDIEPDGHLLLMDTSGLLRRYAFKEVQFVLH